MCTFISTYIHNILKKPRTFIDKSAHAPPHKAIALSFVTNAHWSIRT